MRLLLLVTTFLFGCFGSKPTIYYVFDDEPIDKACKVSVIVPEYLRQSSIVTFIDSNRYVVSDLSKWGEPLELGMKRLLSSPPCQGNVLYQFARIDLLKKGNVNLIGTKNGIPFEKFVSCKEINRATERVSISNLIKCLEDEVIKLKSDT
jgi:hypothetical protein